MYNASSSTHSAGYSLAVLNCWLSAFASVYTEKIMKSKEKDTGMTDSIHWQNLQMYTFGAIFASASVAIDRGMNPTASIFFSFSK